MFAACMFAKRNDTCLYGFSQQILYKRRKDTMVGTKAIRLPASLCSLEYSRILPASLNRNKFVIISVCACTLVQKFLLQVALTALRMGVCSRVKVHGGNLTHATAGQASQARRVRVFSGTGGASQWVGLPHHCQTYTPACCICACLRQRRLRVSARNGRQRLRYTCLRTRSWVLFIRHS